MTKTQLAVISALAAHHAIRRRLGKSWTHVEFMGKSYRYHPNVLNSTVDALVQQGRITIETRENGWSYLILK